MKDQTKQSKWIAYTLLVILMALGLFKDIITPDYLNTPGAYFLNPKHPDYLGVFASHLAYPLFWIRAYAYSIVHIIIPYFIIKYLYSNTEATYTAIILIAVCLSLYVMLYIDIQFVTTRILTKVNRYFHAPLLSFILIAGFTLFKRNESA